MSSILTERDPAFCNHSLHLSELIMPYQKKKAPTRKAATTTSKFPITYLILLLNKKTGNRR